MDTVAKKLSSAQAHELKKFADRVSKFEVSFGVCNADGQLLIFRSCDESDNPINGSASERRQQLIAAGLQALNSKTPHNSVSSDSDVIRLGDNGEILAITVRTDSNSDRFAVLLAPVDDRQVGYFTEMLILLAENCRVTVKGAHQIELISVELSETYEEMALLHKLSSNMNVTKSDADFLQMACDSVTDIVNVEGIAIVLERTVDDNSQLVLAAGSGLIDIDRQIPAVLYDRLIDEISSGNEALVDSEVDSPFKYDWPNNIKSIIAVPLTVKEKMAPGTEDTKKTGAGIIGFMVAINTVDKPDFDCLDIKLFNSVANGCAVFVENGMLFRDLKELFIGSLKALTSSIDAKDKYTRGHSERVAFISRWIAERFIEPGPARDEQIHKIYLAGLLHDIGKVGIDEAVLCKEGKLSEHEQSLIKKHPSIGAGILNEIKQMRDIIPGVLYHHEHIDGTGYPSGLKGNQLPLIGKIVGLADSFDAMTSKRSYRNAMTVTRALDEIEKGLGTQFDEHVGRAFLNSNIYQLWDTIQEGFSEFYGPGKFSEYDAIAVGTLLR